MKCKWFIGAIVIAALGLLDLKCKGTVYKLLPEDVQQQVDHYLQ
ncbi:MAG: hypothetical protein UHX00_15270 [Caryophanon sp.]|nr:hypothetical protein [Caryophanon latum]MEE1132977.1 hypothetical protein [Caryophanon sp.]